MKSLESEPQKLMDQLMPPSPGDELIGMLATTFELQPDFVETDLLPTIFALGAWDDRSWTSRIAIERRLQQLGSAVLFQAAEQYRGRVRSLQLEIVPVPRHGTRVLHAKVVVLVYESSVRLLVGSANLTEPGYRGNREVAVALTASEQKPAHSPLIHQCLTAMPQALGSWWTAGAARVMTDALNRISAWMPTPQRSTDEWFAWSGGSRPLWSDFLDHWPSGEQVHTVSIASPFWSRATRGGPVEQFLVQLRDAGYLVEGAIVRLLAEARVEDSKSMRPVLPETYASFDLRPFGVVARAYPVDPTVSREETGVDDARLRALHAKVVLLEGSTSSLAYLGSANFSRHGWGFLQDVRTAHIEAGMIMRRTGKSRAQLAALLPPTIGNGVALDGAASGKLALAKTDDPSALWPSFLREVRLVRRDSDRQELDLEVSLDPALVKGTWRLEIDSSEDTGTPAVLLSAERSDLSSSRRALLSPQQLKRLLYAPHVSVHWWASSTPREYPINVEDAARDELPVAPGAGRPGENLLLQYYQSRITFEEMFPPDGPEYNGADDPDQASPGSDDMGVDTSRIQSYQIREFVEALRGIHDDLRRASSAPGGMRQSLLGPVSPSALASLVADAVAGGSRSATAGAFQLVEIDACLSQARTLPVKESLQANWIRWIDEASTRIELQLKKIRAAASRESRGTGSFARYEKAVRDLTE